MNFDIQALESTTQLTHDVIVGHLADTTDADGKVEPGAKVGFVVVGPASPEYSAADRRIQMLNIQDANKRKTSADLTTEAGAGAVVDGGSVRQMIIIQACTVGWFGFTDGGKPFEFSAENLARMLKARPNWVGRLLGAIENEANFAGA
ncbi:hypothetical protein [Variovorax paradoxus]|jgi:hypothetical protein|uniref:Uncharacterized protein n=1 Tax=Variovorax paradoxus TaxID=34073 RepID=A0A679JIA8_VARPD|nr:hypothetical protein VVAX_03532 [Variovorax paradoxus]